MPAKNLRKRVRFLMKCSIGDMRQVFWPLRQQWIVILVPFIHFCSSCIIFWGLKDRRRGLAFTKRFQSWCAENGYDFWEQPLFLSAMMNFFLQHDDFDTAHRFIKALETKSDWIRQGSKNSVASTLYDKYIVLAERASHEKIADETFERCNLKNENWKVFIFFWKDTFSFLSMGSQIYFQVLILFFVFISVPLPLNTLFPSTDIPPPGFFWNFFRNPLEFRKHFLFIFEKK